MTKSPLKSTSTQDQNHLTQAIFWILFVSMGFYVRPLSWTFAETLFWSIINTLFFAIAVNINLYVLIPRIMLKQSIVVYLSLLMAVSLLLTPLISIFNIWMIGSDEPIKSKWMLLPQFHFINLLIVSSLSTVVRLPMDWLRMQAEKNELITKNVETELQSLKNQINPHFLFNTLNNLYALTLKKSELAPKIVLKLSDMMRYMLYECNEPTVAISKEIHYIENYIDLEKLRYSAETEIKMEVDPQLNEFRIAPLLLIPFVENSFKHGAQPSVRGAFIHIGATLVDKHLHFSVYNSKPHAGPGPFYNSTKHGGVGLVNARKRLDLIYANRYELHIDNTPETYRIELIIDLNININDTNTDHR